MTETEPKPDFKLKTDTPYPTLMGELWGVSYENLTENLLCYNGTLLYLLKGKNTSPEPLNLNQEQDGLGPDRKQGDFPMIYMDWKQTHNGHGYVSIMNSVRQNGRHFTDIIFKCISLNENFWSLDKISLKYVPYGLIDNKAILFQIKAWHLTADKLLSGAMLVYCTDTYMRHSASMS